MILKIVALFLVFIGVLGWFGKMHWIGGKTLSQRKCNACGRYRIGKGPCACGGKRG
jgi:purine-cytosine permease-like protein